MSKPNLKNILKRSQQSRINKNADKNADKNTNNNSNMQLSNINHHDMELEMKKYNFMHALEEKKNYKNVIDSKTKEEKQDLAQYIHNNYNKMDEIEMQIIALKCLTPIEIKKILLSYELKNYECSVPLKKLSLLEFKCQALNVFNKYQSKAGGFLLEDNQWIVYDSSSTLHEIKENELLFENTIDMCDVDDDETDEYLECIVSKLNLIAKNISVEIRQRKNDGCKAMSFLIWVTDEDMEIDEIFGL